ncbi:phospholipase D-like protein [Salsuginibacillus halophilus]|uniref:Phospholipase D-like protein n=2 Tax=Salsuginibacillus halophilus TaxID=517424 RepID=A0A2P8HBP7_9BACI|nr:phospholipase D-like protein [Salsuginibacillus halophilus]
MLIEPLLGLFGFGGMLLILFFFILIPFILNLLTSIWAYRDAIRRGNSKEYAIGMLLLTLFFPIIGLIIYLLIRND